MEVCLCSDCGVLCFPGGAYPCTIRKSPLFMEEGGGGGGGGSIQCVCVWHFIFDDPTAASRANTLLTSISITDTNRSWVQITD